MRIKGKMIKLEDEEKDESSSGLWEVLQPD